MLGQVEKIIKDGQMKNSFEKILINNLQITTIIEKLASKQNTKTARSCFFTLLENIETSKMKKQQMVFLSQYSNRSLVCKALKGLVWYKNYRNVTSQLKKAAKKQHIQMLFSKSMACLAQNMLRERQIKASTQMFKMYQKMKNLPRVLR